MTRWPTVLPLGGERMTAKPFYPRGSEVHFIFSTQSWKLELAQNNRMHIRLGFWYFKPTLVKRAE